MRSDSTRPTRHALRFAERRTDRYEPRRRADVGRWQPLLDPFTIVTSVCFALFLAGGIALLYAWFS